MILHPLLHRLFVSILLCFIDTRVICYDQLALLCLLLQPELHNLNTEHVGSVAPFIALTKNDLGNISEISHSSNITRCAKTSLKRLQ